LPSSLSRRKERVQTSITMPRTDSCAVPIGCSVDYPSIIGQKGGGVKEFATPNQWCCLFYNQIRPTNIQTLNLLDLQ